MKEVIFMLILMAGGVAFCFGLAHKAKRVSGKVFFGGCAMTGLVTLVNMMSVQGIIIHIPNGAINTLSFLSIAVIFVGAVWFGIAVSVEKIKEKIGSKKR